MAIVDPDTGERHSRFLCVAMLAASRYGFVEAHAAQDLPHWIQGHGHAFAAFQGVLTLLVPNNPKAAVWHADPYEPGINRTCAEMAEHYGTVVLPARPRKPRDKGPVANHVHRIEQWVIAPLRNQTFFTDGALQQAIQTQVDGINARPFQKLDGSRVTWWETLDRPALRPLPPTPYE